MKRIFPCILLLVLTITSIGCNFQGPKKLTSNRNVEEPKVINITEKNTAVTDFAVRLFQNSFKEDENILISPVSVLSSLAIVANGAEGDTLAQIEEIIGLSVEDLNEYLYSYNYHLSEISNRKNNVYLNNSIWIEENDNLTIYDEFLHINDTYYDVSIYKTPFDENCVEDINNWADRNTKGIIPKVIDTIPQDNSIYLINTSAFKGKWQNRYHEVRPGDFISRNGTRQSVDFMKSEGYLYINYAKTVGFIRYYEDKNYAFAVLMPKEDGDIGEYIQTLNGNLLQKLLGNPERVTIDTIIPKFSAEYEIEMSEVLKNMGMMDAFNSEIADFSSMGHNPDQMIFLDNILHKTHIDVMEKGTTEAATDTDLAFLEPDDTDHFVWLNRPFVYILMDCENCIPLLMGTFMSVE